jgi:hypothetical protein
MSEYTSMIDTQSVKIMQPSRDRGNIETLVMEITDSLSTTHEYIAQLESNFSVFLTPDDRAEKADANVPTPPMSAHAEELRKIHRSIQHLNERLYSIRQRVDL